MIFKKSPWIALALSILGFAASFYIALTSPSNFILCTLAAMVGVVSWASLVLIIPLIEIWGSDFKLPTKIIWTIALFIGYGVAATYYYVVERKNVMKSHIIKKSTAEH